MRQFLPTVSWVLLLLLFVPLPFGTDRKTLLVPWVTYGLIALNCFVFAAFSLLHIDPVARWELVPHHPRFYTLLTSLFIHYGFMHLMWNMLFLWLFAPSVEDALKSGPFLIFYICGGIAAGLLHMAIVNIFAPAASAVYSPLVGASGAVAAVLGLYIIRFHRSRIRLYWLAAGFLDTEWGKLEIPALGLLVVWLLQNAYGAILTLFDPDRTFIAYWAHMGGFIFGMVAADLTGMFGEGNQEYLLTNAGAAESRRDIRGDIVAAQSSINARGSAGMLRRLSLR